MAGRILRGFLWRAEDHDQAIRMKIGMSYFPATLISIPERIIGYFSMGAGNMYDIYISIGNAQFYPSCSALVVGVECVG